MRRAPSRRPPVPHTPAHRRSESPLPPSSPDNRRPLSERPHPSDITRILFIGEIADKRLSKIFVEIFPPPEKIFLHLSALSPTTYEPRRPRTMHRFRLILLPLCLFATATAIGQTVTVHIVDERQQPVAGVVEFG